LHHQRRDHVRHQKVAGHHGHKDRPEERSPEEIGEIITKGIRKNYRNKINKMKKNMEKKINKIEQVIQLIDEGKYKVGYEED